MDQNLEDYFSRLNLSASSSSHHRQSPPLLAALRRDYGGREAAFGSSIGAGGVVFSSQASANLRRFGSQEMYGPMGSEWAQWNPTVLDLPACSYPTAASEASHNDDGPSLDQRHDEWSSLLNKEELLQQLNQFSVFDFRGQILSLAKDQYGCRFLQTKLEHPKVEEVEMILVEVIEHIGELMKDQFANYFLQRLMKVCNERQKTCIVISLCRPQFQLISVCLNPHGTRAVQKLLECVTCQQQVTLLMSALRPGAVVLSIDPNGHHVIQQCLMRFSNEDNMPLLNAIANNCVKIATSKSGCCVLQSCVEHRWGDYRERMVDEIIANALILADDPYGNYVVQHLLGLRIPEVTDSLLRKLKGSFIFLSRNKYASNVVEKFLTESSTEKSSQIIMELLKSPNVCLLLVDPFGNFVIQSALVVSRGFPRNALLALVRLNAPFMQTNHYGKKILDRLDKMGLRYV